MRAIHLYCDLVSGAVLDGLQAELRGAGVDVGEQAEPPVEVPPAVEAEAGSQEQATA
jgi:small subunit ribosomal protein S2